MEWIRECKTKQMKKQSEREREREFSSQNIHMIVISPVLWRGCDVFFFLLFYFFSEMFFPNCLLFSLYAVNIQVSHILDCDTFSKCTVRYYEALGRLRNTYNRKNNNNNFNVYIN